MAPKNVREITISLHLAHGAPVASRASASIFQQSGSLRGANTLSILAASNRLEIQASKPNDSAPSQLHPPGKESFALHAMLMSSAVEHADAAGRCR